MKKVLSSIVCIVMALCLCGCGNVDSGSTNLPTEDTILTESTEPQSQPAVSDELVDYASYAGSWGEGRLWLTLSGQTMEVQYMEGDERRVADFCESFNLSEIENSSVAFSYRDSWDNMGSCVLTFGDEFVTVEIQAPEIGPENIWGIFSGTHTFTRDA